MMALAGLIVGIALLLGGGALLVRGASLVAARYGIPPMVVALTIVAFGTSAPELVVNVIGAARGATSLAFGNIVGSNISNLALILGAAALMAPLTIQGQVVRREVPLLLLATSFLTVMALDTLLGGEPSVIGRSDSILLLLLFCVFVYYTTRDILQARHSDALMGHIETNPLIDTELRGRFGWASVAAGIALLFVGGEMTIRSGVQVAALLGISATIVGLFIVSVGTSMPELATSMIAAGRKESDLAVGNVVGSNVFNTLAVLPATGLTREIPVPGGGVGDVIFSLLLTALLIPLFIFGRAHIGRASACFLLIVYTAYVVARVSLETAI